MEVLIRNAKKEEAALLAQIEAECFPAAEAAGKQDIEARMDVFEDCFFVAETNGKIVGFDQRSCGKRGVFAGSDVPRRILT